MSVSNGTDPDTGDGSKHSSDSHPFVQFQGFINGSWFIFLVIAVGSSRLGGFARYIGMPLITGYMCVIESETTRVEWVGHSDGSLKTESHPTFDCTASFCVLLFGTGLSVYSVAHSYSTWCTHINFPTSTTSHKRFEHTHRETIRGMEGRGSTHRQVGR